MKLGNIAALLFVALATNVVFAQSETQPVSPAPTPPIKPVVPPVPVEPIAAQQPRVAEGVLVRSQRATNNDKGTFEWVCTYRVDRSTRGVQLDESCPQTMPFSFKR